MVSYPLLLLHISLECLLLNSLPHSLLAALLELIHPYLHASLFFSLVICELEIDLSCHCGQPSGILVYDLCSPQVRLPLDLSCFQVTLLEQCMDRLELVWASGAIIGLLGLEAG